MHPSPRFFKHWGFRNIWAGGPSWPALQVTPAPDLLPCLCCDSQEFASHVSAKMCKQHIKFSKLMKGAAEYGSFPQQGSLVKARLQSTPCTPRPKEVPPMQQMRGNCAKFSGPSYPNLQLKRFQGPSNLPSHFTETKTESHKYLIISGLESHSQVWLTLMFLAIITPYCFHENKVKSVCTCFNHGQG